MDALAERSGATAWLDRHRLRFRPPLPSAELVDLDDRQFDHLRLLRDISRRLLVALVEGQPPNDWDIAQLNRASSLAHSWPTLSWPAGQPPTAQTVYVADALLRAQTELAQTLIALLAGERRHLVRACTAPGCVLFFYRDHPRRRWCSSGCGNRARVARHYQRHLGDPPATDPEQPAAG